MLGLNNRQIDFLVLAFQGVTTVFCGLFTSVYLLGLRDLPETVVYHADSTFRAALSAFVVLSLLLVVLTIVVSLVKRRKED